jgi:GH35 family endo-1,4-beta-xylanase
MTKQRSAFLRACLLASLPLSAWSQAPVIVEAETGTLGSSLSIGSVGDVTYITGLNGTTTPTADRVASYQVTFPSAGNYDLYVRVLVGPVGGSDDSFYIPSGFNSLAWTGLYNTSQGGHSAPGATVNVVGFAGQNVWKWIRLTNHPGTSGGIGPNAWVVPDGSLTQTFNWGSREDGLLFDKFAFGPAGTCYTVAQLDGAAGTAACPPPPPPPPPAYTYPGPPIATGQAKFLGSAWSPGNASINFTNYFNKVTPENAGKWGSAEPQRDVFNWTDLDTAYNLAKSNGWPFHFHVLVWGNQQPNWIDELPVEEQLAEIHEWFAAVAARYPDIDILEVANEPLHDPPCTRENGGGGYCEALGGTGPRDSATEWTWVLNSFRLARQYFPRAKLMLNDYSIENETPQTTRYINLIMQLKRERLIDIVGLQGHAFSQSEPAPMPTYRANLDRIAALGFPIHITELDVDGTDDAVQLAGMQKIFPLYWEHPGVTGITLWGYVQNNHWRNAQGAWLVWSQAGSEGAERPAMQWIHRYVHNARAVIPWQSYSVSNGAANGTPIGTVSATDTDAGTVFSGWRVEASGPYASSNGNGLFAIDAATGALTVADAATLANVPKGTVLKLFLSVFDGYTRSAVKSIEIRVN